MRFRVPVVSMMPPVARRMVPGMLMLTSPWKRTLPPSLREWKPP
jgi:hypothetical protein